MVHDPMIVHFRFSEEVSASQPIQVLFHVADVPDFERPVDLAKMKAFSARSSTFMDELRTESDRGALLIATEFLADLLKDLITARMVKLTKKMNEDLFAHSTGALKSLSSRIKLSFSLGWIGPDMHADLESLRSMRNNFAAHSPLAMRFTDAVVSKECATFKALRFFSGDLREPRNKFFFTVSMLTLQLNWLIAISQEPQSGIDPTILMDINPEGSTL